MRPIDGHAADRIEQHDVVDDRLGRSHLELAGRRPATVAGPGEATKSAGPAADLDELGQDREGDLLGRLGAEVHPGRRAQRRRSARARASSPRAATRGRRRPASATRPGRRTRRRGSARRRRPPRPRCPGSRRRRTARRRVQAPDVGPDDDPLGAGNASASAIGSMTVTRQPAAAPSGASAPAIGVVPATHRSGAGRCGST